MQAGIRGKSMTTDTLIDAISSRVHVIVKTGSGIMICCPFHNDKEPSMYVANGFGHCFSCGKSFSGKTLLKALGINQPLRTIRVEKKRKQIKLNTKDFDVYSKTLQNSYHAIAYIKSRGINDLSIKKWKIGYGRPPFLSYPRFVFPVYDHTNKIVTVSYRKDPQFDECATRIDKQKYVIQPGTHSFLYGLNHVWDKKKIVYCGGIIDAILMNQYDIPAIGAMGENVFAKEWKQLLSNKSIFIMLDNDTVGKKASQMVKDVLGKNSIIVEWWNKSEEKDIADVLCKTKNGYSLIRNMLAELDFFY